MIEKQREAMAGWAASHGLSFTEEGCLPPATTKLKAGLGVGEQRSSLRKLTPGRSMFQDGWTRRRPERATLNLCQGRLPGGLTGSLGHHVSLQDRGRGRSEGESRYLASVSTVVYAELPYGSRPVFNLQVGPQADVKAAFELGRQVPTDDPLKAVVDIPGEEVEIEGRRWCAWPAEARERIEAIAGGDARRALLALPPEVRVEYESGRLCAYMPGHCLTDGSEIESLCRLASGVAEGLRRVTEAEAALDLDSPLPLASGGARDRWVEAGVATVDWPQPPPSVTAARQAYADVMRKPARKVGWKVWGVGGIAMFAASAIFAAVWFVALWLTGPLLLAVLGAAAIVLLGLRSANRVGLKVGQMVMDSRVDSASIPWGLEAFARGYARSSGLAQEDPEELRRRLPMPIPGRAQKAWQGDLGNGIHGHLALWIDATPNPEPVRHWLIAVVPRAVDLPAPYRVAVLDGLAVIGVEVNADDRAIHRLDDLRRRATGEGSVRRVVSPRRSIDPDGRPLWAESAT